MNTVTIKVKQCGMNQKAKLYISLFCVSYLISVSNLTFRKLFRRQNHYQPPHFCIGSPAHMMFSSKLCPGNYLFWLDNDIAEGHFSVDPILISFFLLHSRSLATFLKQLLLASTYAINGRFGNFCLTTPEKFLRPRFRGKRERYTQNNWTEKCFYNTRFST